VEKFSFDLLISAQQAFGFRPSEVAEILGGLFANEDEEKFFLNC